MAPRFQTDDNLAMHSRAWPLVVLSFATYAACSSASSESPGAAASSATATGGGVAATGGGQGGNGQGGSGAATGDGGATSAGTTSVSSSGGASGFDYEPAGAGGGSTCAATEVKGKKTPLDIVFAVDTSSSMSAEIAEVKANINGSFAAVLGQGDLDYRVVMLAAKGTGTFQICVAEPLGGPNCGSNLPIYRAVPQVVGSTNPLSLLLSTYDSLSPSLNWSGFLRPEATKAFVVVTDDNSAVAATTFDSELLAKAPLGMFGTAQKRKYVFYGIIGIDKNNASLKCPDAVNNGSVYQSLVALTGGAQFSECEADYSPVFKAIADNVVAKLSCEFTFPKNDPNGKALDPDKVAVKLVDSMQQSTAFPRVNDASKCVGPGWHYDDNLAPTKILLCPAACTKVQGTAGGQVTIDMGCLQG